ncbi:MAG: WYL domain-containing protein [Pseudanabaena sp.]|uniref:WYL domain-containing protein n=1 Tax=Cyanophyceae TaxID=3028117 RepID=UPI002576F0C1|nr:MULTISPECIES: WYL domain-containing protein [Cyanophyceae]MCA2882345.1 WYL domain-containing protein [Microcystis sp. M046S1]MCA6604965.1 WYL domain-containing protein [Pseudanabaena sp. M007S1SP1A06QC]MCA6623915.1 WYL domain-containing protein [Pseudanabaena sp. M165S2SP1A06QC]MCE2978017.1 WYL domain-containing protein [Pseudanabaena sp. CoA8_M7]
MSRKGESITLSIKERDKANLEAIAIELGMTWGDRPNISKLVEAIARKQIQISKNNDWASDRLEALSGTFRLLVDYGDREKAQIIAHLLLERSELNKPLRREIEQFLNKPPEIWRHTIDRYIKQQQPFRLQYLDAAERHHEFSIYYAQVTPHDKRLYLDCWCEDIAASDDVIALNHNRCLRLDRIPAEAAITPIQGKWRTQLDHIFVTFNLSGKLAFAYQQREGDIDNTWLDTDPPMRQVIRKITSTFWFYREILPYAEDCEILEPADVRERFKAKVRSLYIKYSG